MSNKIIIGIILTMLLIAPVSASMLDDVNQYIGNLITGKTRSLDEARERGIQLLPASIISYAGSVPVQIGFNTVTNFWVLTATIGWTYDKLTLIKLSNGDTDSNNKAQKDVAIEIYPMGAYSTAPLTYKKIYFKTNAFDSESNEFYGVADSYKVEGGAWITTSMYDIRLGANPWNYVDINPSSPSQINLGGGAFVNNLGILPNGANIPSGEFIIVIDPNEKPHIVRELDFQNAITYWNQNDANTYIVSRATWTDVWNTLQSKGKLPQNILLTQRPEVPTKVYYDCGTGTYYTDCYVSKGETYKKVKVKYPMTAMSSVISVYIPSSMADTIVVNIGGSKGVLIGTPTITKVSDKQYAELKVSVTNTGGKDYISVKPTSSYYSFEVVGDNTKLIDTGGFATFIFKAYALNVASDCNNCAPVNILVDGTDPANGDSSTVIYGTIYDSDTVVNTDAKLIVTAYAPDNSILSDAEIYINGYFKGRAKVDITLPKGEYILSSKNTTKYYAPSPKTITMNGVSKSEGLYFTEFPKETEIDLTWVFWLFLVAVSVGGFWYTKNPLFLILGLLVGALYFGLLILESLNQLADKANPFNWFK